MFNLKLLYVITSGLSPKLSPLNVEVFNNSLPGFELSLPAKNCPEFVSIMGPL